MKLDRVLLFALPLLLVGGIVLAQGGELTKAPAGVDMEQRIATLEARQRTLTARLNDLETELVRGRRKPDPLQYAGLDDKVRKIALVSRAGEFLVLDDGSGWDVRTESRKLTEYWSVGDSVRVYLAAHESHPYVLVNLDRKYGGTQPEAVEAAHIKSK